MSYLVLARKWRPQTFDDLVGQEHVSRTLGNAIASDRVAHAFLFTGVRGVGKTTSARIMAKALNCEKGPTASPCLVCAPCREITAGSDVDVQEIDGASYNGVDEVRRLQESLPYRPARDRYKIFIIDEVHMLSQNAWNAFLKTLEEPPPHIKFIFATTEVHKVPVTILSRCQRYDFKLIPTQLIAKRLRYVLGEEKIEADDAAVALVAREAAGSLRDAMSLLDQAIAWGGDQLVGSEVSRVLGVASRSVIHQIAQGLLAGDAGACLSIVADLADQGYDVSQVARGILAELRDLVVVKVCREPDRLLDLADDESAEVKALGSAADADDLVRLHHGFSTAFDEVATSADSRAALEMLLVRLARRPPLVPIDDMVARLLDLEQRLGSGGPAPQGPPRAAGGGGVANPSRPPNRGPSAAPSSGPPTPGASGASPAAPLPSNAPLASAMQRPTTGAVSPRPVTTLGAAPSRNASSSAAEASPFTVPVITARAPSPAPTSSPLRTAVSAAPDPAFSAPAFTESVRSAEPTRTAEPACIVEPARPAEPLPRPPHLETWRAILARVRGERSHLASIFEHASPITVSPERVVLGYEQGSFLAAQATESANVELLTRHVREHFGMTTPVAFDLSAGPRSSPTLAAIDAEDRRIRLDQARLSVANHPLVRAAIDILGAELKDVKVTDS